MNKELANQIAQAFDQTLYHSKYCTTARANAQSMLIGRTHYADDNTLRYFGARITLAQPSTFGLFYRITESVGRESYGGKRGFRTVLFDVNGQTVYRPALEEMQSTSTKAEKVFYEWFQTFDIVAHYREQIALKATRTRDQTARLETAFNALCDEVTV
jgi:hypothetical protein